MSHEVPPKAYDDFQKVDDRHEAMLTSIFAEVDLQIRTAIRADAISSHPITCYAPSFDGRTPTEVLAAI